MLCQIAVMKAQKLLGSHDNKNSSMLSTVLPACIAASIFCQSGAKNLEDSIKPLMTSSFLIT
jgi:hypothetical protein